MLKNVMLPEASCMGRFWRYSTKVEKKTLPSLERQVIGLCLKSECICVIVLTVLITADISCCSLLRWQCERLVKCH